jgi:hypothetical protein
MGSIRCARTWFIFSGPLTISCSITPRVPEAGFLHCDPLKN